MLFLLNILITTQTNGMLFQSHFVLSQDNQNCYHGFQWMDQVNGKSARPTPNNDDTSTNNSSEGLRTFLDVDLLQSRWKMSQREKRRRRRRRKAEMKKKSTAITTDSESRSEKPLTGQSIAGKTALLLTNDDKPKGIGATSTGSKIEIEVTRQGFAISTEESRSKISSGGDVVASLSHKDSAKKSQTKQRTNKSRIKNLRKGEKRRDRQRYLHQESVLTSTPSSPEAYRDILIGTFITLLQSGDFSHLPYQHRHGPMSNLCDLYYSLQMAGVIHAKFPTEAEVIKTLSAYKGAPVDGIFMPRTQDKKLLTKTDDDYTRPTYSTFPGFSVKSGTASSSSTSPSSSSSTSLLPSIGCLTWQEHLQAEMDKAAEHASDDEDASSMRVFQRLAAGDSEIESDFSYDDEHLYYPGDDYWS